MEEIYELVKTGKTRQKIESDRGFALANNIHPQVIADLKSGKCLPNAMNMLRILAAAGLDVNDGIKAIERQKEAGFSNLTVMLSIMSGSVVTLTAMSPMLYQSIVTGFITGSLYIMSNEKEGFILVIGSEIQGQLSGTLLHDMTKLAAINDAEICQVSAYCLN